MRKTANRNLILASGVIVLLCMGLIYAWSVFAAPLEAEFGWTRTQTSLTFSISMLGFSLGGLAAGYIQKLKSPRFVVMLGSILIVAGFLACSQASQLWHLFVFYGAIAGTGVGLCYNCWLGTTLANFNDRTGFASGWLLMGFGLGGFLLGKVASALMYSDIGWRRTFILIGAAVFLIGLVTLPMLRLPRTEEKSSSEEAREYDFRPIEMVQKKHFWLYLFWCWILLGLGLAVIGQAASFAVDVGATASFSATAVGLLSIGNGFSRIVLGIIFDRKGRRTAAFTATFLTLIGSVMMAVSYGLGSLPLMVAALFLCGFGYGAISSVNPASTRVLFGGANFQKNFGLIFLLSSPAIFIGNSAAGVIKTATGSYRMFFLGAVAVAAVGLILQLFMEKSIEHFNKATKSGKEKLNESS